jgi:hypothetical protein
VRVIPILLAGILILGGLGAIASPIKNTSIRTKSICFSEPKITDENNYVTINLDETNTFIINQNKPLLPKYTELFEFPFGTKIKSVSCTPSLVYEKTLTKKLEPSPEPVIIGTELSKSSENNLDYGTEPYPNTWYAYDVGSGLDGKERVVYVNVEVYPVQYYPLENKITWANKAEINVEYEEPSQPVYFGNQYEFVILTSDGFSSQLNSLITHKNSMGISTKIVTLSEIYHGTYFCVKGRDNPEKIKYFIKNAIENWGTTFVMLVGGAEQFPVRETHVHAAEGDDEIFASDLYYADIFDKYGGFCSWDSNNNDVFGEFKWGPSQLTDKLDLRPDIYLARLACTDTNEVATAVNKIINYESSVAYTQDWFTNLVTCGGDTFPGDGSGTDEGEYVNTAIINIMNNFTPNEIWASNGRLTGDSPTGVEEINSAINAGAGFVDFSGHGGPGGWGTHPHENENIWIPTPDGFYVNSHVSDLTNGEKLPIVVIGACSCSKFTEDPNCFGWSFISNPNGGGIGSFGAAALGWAYVGKAVTSGLIEGMTTKIFKAYKNEGAKTFGEMWGNAINRYVSTVMQGVDYKTVEEWQPFGDPTLAVAAQTQPPLKPTTPSGPSSGTMRTTYNYTTNTTDPDGDKIYYLFSWGDGTSSGWIGPKNSGDTVKASHNWTRRGSYEIRVVAKDQHGAISEWSDPLSVTMPKARSVNSPFLKFLLNRFPHLFPILRYLMGL